MAPEFDSVGAVETLLRNPLEILSGFHQIILEQEQQRELYHGRPIELENVPGDLTLGVSQDQQLLSVLKRVDDTVIFKPTKNFFRD